MDELFACNEQNPLLERLNPLDAGFLSSTRYLSRESKSVSSWNILLFCTQGTGIVERNGAHYTLHEGDAICIPAGSVYNYQADPNDPWAFLWAHFVGEDAACYPLAETGVVHLCEDAADTLRELFKKLLVAIEAPYKPGNLVYAASVLGHILGYIYYRRESAAGDKALCERIAAFMTENIAGSITTEQVCKKFEISPSTLYTLFKRQTDQAPLAFFIRMKMNKACAMLRATTLPVHEVGRQLGYTDAYYFSRLFKKVVGTSPQGYRKEKQC